MKQYIVDAFTSKVFAGNPAAVCILDQWLPDELMQKIAVENNLSMTAFSVKEDENYRLRWFSPRGEVELCGHATLATGYLIMEFVEPGCTRVGFHTAGGFLAVNKSKGMLTMDLPTYALRPIPVTRELTAALGGVTPVEAYMGADIVCVLENEEQVRSIVPNHGVIRSLEGVCFHTTAQGNTYDCVTRSFAPKHNVPEDPACGRGHCHVVSLWSKKLGKIELAAYQASPRGAELFCRYAGERTILSGKAVLFSEAEIYI